MRLSIRRKIVLFIVMPLVGLCAVFSILNAVRMRRETAAFVEDNPDLNSEQIYTQLQTNLELSPLVCGSAVCFEPYHRDPDRRLLGGIGEEAEDETPT